MTKRNADRVEDEREGQEISRDLGGGLSRSQPRRGGVNFGAGIRDRPAQTGADEQRTERLSGGFMRRTSPPSAASCCNDLGGRRV